MQSLLLPLALAKGSSTLTLKGGTHVAWSPPVHYLEWVLFPLLARMGLEASIDLRKWGWFPKGGGEVQVVVKGNSRLKGIDLRERGPLLSVKGVAGASSLPANIPQRIADRANNVLRSAGLPRGVEPVRTSERSTGAGIVLAAIYEHGAAGFTSLGTKGKPSELVANEAADALIAHHLGGYALDAHLPDQLLLAMAFADGPSRMATAAVTRHTLTNAAVIGLFLDRPLTIEGDEGSPGLVTVG